MKALRLPLLLALFCLSCWGAFEFGYQDQTQPPPSALVPKNAGSLQESRSDRERTIEFTEEWNSYETVEEFRNAIDRLQFKADKSEENRLLSLLFQRWLEVAPVDALSEVRRIENLRHDILRTSRVFEKWATDFPNEAQLLLTEVLDGRQSDPNSHPPFLDGVDPPEYVLSMISGLSKIDPNSTAKLLQEMAGSPIRFHALDVLLQNWFPNQPETVYRWATELEVSPFRLQAISKTAANAGQVDNPQSGISWAQSLDSPQEQILALESLTQQWAARHSRKAFHWLLQQPDDLKFRLAAPVISSLTKVDPGTAADWLNQYEAAPELDAPVAAYAQSLSAINPAAALDSASAITNGAVREKVMLGIAKEWRQANPEAFKRYLQNREDLPQGVSELGL